MKKEWAGWDLIPESYHEDLKLSLEASFKKQMVNYAEIAAEEAVNHLIPENASNALMLTWLSAVMKAHKPTMYISYPTPGEKPWVTACPLPDDDDMEYTFTMNLEDLLLEHADDYDKEDAVAFATELRSIADELERRARKGDS